MRTGGKKVTTNTFLSPNFGGGWPAQVDDANNATPCTWEQMYQSWATASNENQHFLKSYHVVAGAAQPKCGAPK